MSAKVIDVRDNHRFDEAKLAAYLAGEIEGLGALDVKQFAGGQSNPTFLLSSGDRRFVLRKKPPGKLLPSAHLVEREYRVIQALEGSGVPVPKAHLLCEDPEVIGTAFYVMDYVEGRIFASPELPGVAREARGPMYEAMAQTLARLHTVDYAAAGLGDFGKPSGYVARQVKRWSEQYAASATRDIPSMQALMTWLPENIPADEQTTIAHGDFRPGNLLFHPTEPRVVAVLDWELATLGHPLGDLGYFLMAYRLPNFGKELPGLLGVDLEALGIPDQASFVAKYAEHAGRDLPEDLDFFVGFSLFRLAAIAQGVYQRSLQGNASDAKASMFGDAAMLLADLAWSIVSPAG